MTGPAGGSTGPPARLDREATEAGDWRLYTHALLKRPPPPGHKSPLNRYHMDLLRLLRAQSGREWSDELLDRLTGAADGLPVPPPWSIDPISGQLADRLFFERGRRQALGVIETVRAAGADPAAFRRVLDFGCGPGRLLRHMRRLPSVEIHATDRDADAVQWVRRHLRFARSTVNGALPPLSFPDEHFDVVYAQSIFTHMDVPAQRRWLAEIHRVLRRGGVFYFSTHGEYYRQHFPEAAGRTPDGPEFAANRHGPEGEKAFASFQTRELTVGLLPEGLELVRFEPGRPPPAQIQDAYVVWRA
jgi:SAM-dependent methyltransferase